MKKGSSIIKKIFIVSVIILLIHMPNPKSFPNQEDSVQVIINAKDLEIDISYNFKNETGELFNSHNNSNQNFSFDSRIFSIAVPMNSSVTSIHYEITSKDIIPNFNSDNNFVNKSNIAFHSRNKNNVAMSIVPINNSNPNKKVLTFLRFSRYRQYHLLDFKITPYFYNKHTDQFYKAKQLKIDIQFKSLTHSNFAIPKNSPQIEENAKEIIFNYDQAKQWYPQLDKQQQLTSFDMVIITIDSLLDSIDPLIQLEKLKGKNVKIVTISWINQSYEGYDLSAKIRNFLIEKYPMNIWGITDVLLIGDYIDVPTRTIAQNLNHGFPTTDYYYAELSLDDEHSWDKNNNHLYGEDEDSFDFYSEVLIGRIPFSDPDRVSKICNNIASFEQNDDDRYKKNKAFSCNSRTRLRRSFHYRVSDTQGMQFLWGIVRRGLG